MRLHSAYHCMLQRKHLSFMRALKPFSLARKNHIVIPFLTFSRRVSKNKQLFGCAKPPFTEVFKVLCALADQSEQRGSRYVWNTSIFRCRRVLWSTPYNTLSRYWTLYCRTTQSAVHVYHYKWLFSTHFQKQKPLLLLHHKVQNTKIPLLNPLVYLLFTSCDEGSHCTLACSFSSKRRDRRRFVDLSKGWHADGCSYIRLIVFLPWLHK